MTLFFRLSAEEDKASALRLAVDTVHQSTEQANKSSQIYRVDPSEFQLVPGSPFGYWVSGRLRRLFSELAPFETNDRIATVGASTKDDFRFLRMWWEIEPHRSGRSREDTLTKLSWVPFAKGGALSRFYSALDSCINWKDDGLELKAFVSAYREAHGWGDHWRAELHSYQHYFRPGLTWPLRASAFSPQCMPRGGIFSVRGYAILAPDEQLLPLLAVGSSSCFDYVFKILLGRFGHPEFVVGALQRMPVPTIDVSLAGRLGKLARNAWSLKRELDSLNETSLAFSLPLRLRGRLGVFRPEARLDELKRIQAEIDDVCFDLYKIGSDDRLSISQALAHGSDDSLWEGDATEEECEEDSSDVDPDGSAEVLFWSAGVSFGRFDIRLATGARPLPPEPEPFDPLPVCSPGMLTGDDGLPLPSAPPGYPLSFPEDGILVDDPGHSRDLTAAVRAVFDVVFGDAAHDRWLEAAALLDPKNQDLRGWFARSFFEHHIKRYGCRSFVTEAITGTWPRIG